MCTGYVFACVSMYACVYVLYVCVYAFMCMINYGLY